MQARPAAKIMIHSPGLRLQFGGQLDYLEIGYETWGDPANKDQATVLICPAFSADAHAKSSTADPTPGWWEAMIGEGEEFAFDTSKYFVVCCSLLGGCSNTTGPLHLRRPGASIWGGDFPILSIRDLAGVHRIALQHLGVERAKAIVGSSMGAMQALSMVAQFPGIAESVWTCSGTEFTRPATAAIRHLGRRAIMSDPSFNSGHYGNDKPLDGLRLAREIGTVFYRSKEEFNERFSMEPIAHPTLSDNTFDVQSYLDYQGQKVTRSFDANSYLRLSLAMDLFNLSADVAKKEAFKGLRIQVAGVKEDRLMPLAEQWHLADFLDASGAICERQEFSSPVGHDAFLVDAALFTPVIQEFLA